MNVFLVQPASPAALHCFAEGELCFDSLTPARAMDVNGVRSAYLVTAHRPARLVLHPVIMVARDDAQRLYQLSLAVGHYLGFDDLRLLRPVERSDSGPAVDIHDWLRW